MHVVVPRRVQPREISVARPLVEVADPGVGGRLRGVPHGAVVRHVTGLRRRQRCESLDSLRAHHSGPEINCEPVGDNGGCNNWVIEVGEIGGHQQGLR